MKTELQEEFEAWADSAGVSLDHEEDWKPWLDCWEAAILAYVNVYGESKRDQ